MVHVEHLRPDGHAAISELRRMAFGNTDPYDPAAPVIDDDRHSCVYDGDRLVAIARTRAYAQWFGGRAVACGGLSSVMIATDRRAEGLGRAVVTHALHRMRERGEVVSTLFPTTASLYRSLGYEIAGTYRIQRIPLEELPPDTGALDWEPIAWDATEVRSVVNGAGASHDGWVVRPEADWRFLEHMRRRQGPRGDVFVGRRDGAAVAAVGIEYVPSDRAMFSLKALTLVGADHDATRAALAFLGRHGTTADHVDVLLPDHLLHVHIEHPQHIEVALSKPWMTRVVDVAGALSGRGWNPAADAVIDLEVVDELLDHNAGRWRVAVEGGTATVEPGGDGTVRVDAGALAAWYTGHASAASLARRDRLVAHDEDDLHRLAALRSGGEPPTVIHYF